MAQIKRVRLPNGAVITPGEWTNAEIKLRWWRRLWNAVVNRWRRITKRRLTEGTD